MGKGILNLLNQDFKAIYNNYDLINYINLSRQESINILNQRNTSRVREMMVNDKVIGTQNHFDFVESLRGKKSGYWVLKQGKTLIGSISLIDFNENENSFEAGNFLVTDLIGTGKGLLINYITRILAFDKIAIDQLRASVKKGNKSALRINDLFGKRIEIDPNVSNEEYVSFLNLKNEWSENKIKLFKLLKYV